MAAPGNERGQMLLAMEYFSSENDAFLETFRTTSQPKPLAAFADSWKKAGFNVNARQVDNGEFGTVQNTNSKFTAMLNWSNSCVYNSNFLSSWRRISTLSLSRAACSAAGMVCAVVEGCASAAHVQASHPSSATDIVMRCNDARGHPGPPDARR